MVNDVMGKNLILENIRYQLKLKSLDAFIQPRRDMFGGEEVPDYDERLKFLSGFTGSAGMAIVTIDKAVIFIDGRLSDLGKNISINMMPIISIDWKDEFQWRGRGEMSQKDKMHLDELIYQVHLEGKKIRFWGSPDNSISWEVLYNSGVDLINTDKVAALYDYMLQK